MKHIEPANWIKVGQHLPDEDGHYPVSVANGNHVFTYIAAYRSETHQWFKYDAFNPNAGLTDDITDVVVAWAGELSVFIV